MSFIAELLEPISDSQPGGENIYYDPVFQQIKEARREEEEIAQGIWQSERKVADWPLVIQLSTKVLRERSKDLQVAAWLTEALIYRDGFPGLSTGLRILAGILTRFWESCYPEIEDGDLELRANPLNWVGSQLDKALKRVPLTAGGYDFLTYREAKSIPYEEDCGQDAAKLEARQDAISLGKLTPELFGEDFYATPKSFYVELKHQVEDIGQAVEELHRICEEKFGRDTPSFSPLRKTLEEVGGTVHVFLASKREMEPDPPPEPVPTRPAEVPDSPAGNGYVAEPAAAYQQPQPVYQQPVYQEPHHQTPAEGGAFPPSDAEDALRDAGRLARYLRGQSPESPAPYLMLRAYRWGELSRNGRKLDPLLLEPPSSELRRQLKRLWLEQRWSELLEACEEASPLPCSRGWLDLHFYAARAAGELGYKAVSAAITTAVTHLLEQFPGLEEALLLDDTPAANAETLHWIRHHMPGGRALKPVEDPELDEQPEPDAFDLAEAAAQDGRPRDAITILARQLERESTGRGRFQRKVQLAQLCLSSGHEAVARPLLEELVAEVEARRLEDWESPAVVAYPLALLLNCLDRTGGGPEERQRLYRRVCLLDPSQAVSTGS